MAVPWDEQKHPRAPAGSPGGGKFTSGGGGAPASSGGSGGGGGDLNSIIAGARAGEKRGGGRGGAGHGKGAHSARAAARGVLATRGVLSYDPHSNIGTGYGRPDARVRTLQAALNRLGLTDKAGAKLIVDGKYGPLTMSAVEKLQQRLGLKADGKVTRQLLDRVQNLQALPKTPPTPHIRTRHVRAKHAEVPDMTDRVAEAGKAPYGDVTYADPGYQKDKQKRYPLDSEAHVRAAWSYINQADNARLYSAEQLAQIKGRIRAAMKKYGIQASEAVINGARTFDEIEDLVKDALAARMQAQTGNPYPYCCVVDLTDSDVVWTSADEDDLWMCSYEIGVDQSVTLGDPQQVARTYAPVGTPRNPPPEGDDQGDGGDSMGEDGPDDDSVSADTNLLEAVTEAGRVIEAKGTDANGGKVFRVRILKYGVSRNGRDYPQGVIREAVSLYEGAKAYDHHRTAQELETSTLDGLIGHYRGVEAEADGLYGNLHLLPSATHAAEALDASLDAQAAGLAPVVGISHDVKAHFRAALREGRRVQEATQIVGVQSADVVANPSAGGHAVRAVAGGETTTEEESDVPTKADVLAAFKEATDEELAAVGLARAATATESTTSPPVRAVESDAQRTTEAADTAKDSFLGRMLIKGKVEEAGLPAAIVESITTGLPDRITEADVDAHIATLKGAWAMLERPGLRPTVTATVTRESLDKKIASLDAFFWAYGRPRGHWTGIGATSEKPSDAIPYKSFREAFADITGYQPRYLDDEDVNRRILRESFGNGEYEARRGTRATESLSSSSWNLVLGDSITRRLVAEYNEPQLMDWMKIVSSSPPVNDFRTQRIERLGGYGVLPTVAQGAPYQPLTSPTNEEVTYALGKRGGTEDVTLEMIANDDVRAISKIPFHLALAAKRTLFDFVFELIRPVAAGAGPLGTTGNPTIYDSTALYAAGHNNTATNALSQTNLSAARAAMRKQAGYGDAQNILSIIPRYLVVPPTLEELAFQLCTSAVAIPATPAGPTNTPNIHQGLDYIVVDYWDALSSTQWAVVGDPNLVPTVEIGFYQGQRDPQLFTQSDQTVGSMFNSDKFTYKIRHIYSGAILDFRGFQRGNS